MDQNIANLSHENLPESSKLPRFYLTQNEMSNLMGVTPQAISMQAKQKSIDSFKIGSKAAYSPKNVRKFIESKGYRYPTTPKVISFQCLKGGSTKTSTLFNLAVRLASYGAKVLCVDMDGQGNLTDAFSYDVIDQPVFYHVADGQCSIQDVVVNISENLDLIPSDLDNAALDNYFAIKSINLETFVRQKLEPIISNYDFIFIDCNPSLSKLNNSIALASDEVIIPANPDKFSSKGVKKTIEEYKNISQQFNTEIEYQILFTLFDNREASSQKYLIHYGTNYENKLIPVFVRRSADIKNAIDEKKSIFEYPKALAREDLDSVAKLFLGIEFKHDKEKPEGL